jgi:hypothetical protein
MVHIVTESDCALSLPRFRFKGELSDQKPRGDQRGRDRLESVIWYRFLIRGGGDQEAQRNKQNACLLRETFADLLQILLKTGRKLSLT